MILDFCLLMMERKKKMAFKTGNYMTGAGFILVLLMSAVEPMPHSFELFWLHVGLLMIGAVLMGSGVYLTWKGK
jgi:hypothetical protein